MAAPNLRNPITITGKTVLQQATTASVSVLANAAASGKLLRVNMISAANISPTVACTVTLSVKRASSEFWMAWALPVPIGSAVFLLSRSDGPLNLEEGDSIYVLAAANSVIDLIISYEEIS